MRRREFIGLVGGAAAWPLTARAQQTKMHQIGVLLLGNADADGLRRELSGELRQAGFVEGQNLTLNSDPQRKHSFPRSLQSWLP